MVDLKGKVAIVTGAGRGIGKGIALELAKAGSRLILASTTENNLEMVKNEIEKMGEEALAIPMDVSKWEDAQRMSQKALERFGRIDILVNNAGISPKGKGGVPLKILDIDDQLWERVMKVNLKGVFNCSKAVMPHMISQRSGKIVNIGARSGLSGGGAGSPASAAYCTSKAGVICLTKVLARELAQYNINVNTVAPGRILTDMAKITSAAANENMRKHTPLGRDGTVADVSRAVLFLVSESGNYMTGEIMVIDGGGTMH